MEESNENNTPEEAIPEEVDSEEITPKETEEKEADSASEPEAVVETAVAESEVVEQSVPEETAPIVEAQAAESESAPEATAEVTTEPAVKPVVEEEADTLLPPLDPERAKLPWYVVHTYSGYEMRVKLGLEERVRNANLGHKFGHIVVPQEKVVELVRGEKKTSSKKVFPGYMLIQCDLDEETWHLVKATPKVTGFVGDSVNPVPLSSSEVEALLLQMEGGGKKARPNMEYEQGDAIKVIEGPFADFNGTVDEVKPDKGKLRVLISIFGRNTPVELDFVQVEKV